MTFDSRGFLGAKPPTTISQDAHWSPTPTRMWWKNVSPPPKRCCPTTKRSTNGYGRRWALPATCPAPARSVRTRTPWRWWTSNAGSRGSPGYGWPMQPGFLGSPKLGHHFLGEQLPIKAWHSGRYLNLGITSWANSFPSRLGIQGVT